MLVRCLGLAEVTQHRQQKEKNCEDSADAQCGPLNAPQKSTKSRMSPVDQDSRRLDSWSLVEGSYYAKTEWQAPVHGMFKLYNPATRTLRSMAISAEGFASLPPRVRLFFNISDFS